MRSHHSVGRRACQVAVLGAVVAVLVPLGVLSAQQSSRKLLGAEASQHVLNRLTFGARPRQVADVTRVTWQKWVEEQLDPSGIDDSELEKKLAERCPSLRMSLSEFQALDGRDRDERNRLKNELREAVLLQAIYSKREFQEVMVEFWRNHFNVDFNKVPFQATHYEYHAIRKHVFSRFEELLMAVAKHPAMLVYLDNYVSSRRGLNENYARELMELHTLGVDNFYKQPDVIALARVLTGWTCGRRGGEDAGFHFNADAHDDQPIKLIDLEIDGTGGVADGEKAIKYLANHPGTAKFISAKLCKYLVNDNPPPKLVERAAEAFLETGGDLRDVYRAIIFSQDFMDPKNFRAKFKTPFEFTVSVLRTTSADVGSSDRLFRELQLMGQPIYECLEPTGYSDMRESWLDPGVMIYRWNFTIALVTDKLAGVKVGKEFADTVLQATQADRTRKVMETCLPGVNDVQTRQFVSQTPDIRAMVALALGSASYQQQ